MREYPEVLADMHRVCVSANFKAAAPEVVVTLRRVHRAIESALTLYAPEGMIDTLPSNLQDPITGLRQLFELTVELRKYAVPQAITIYLLARDALRGTERLFETKENP